MKRLNFDSFKNLDVPETWIENALNVPKRKSTFSYLNFSRITATVACFVVACTTSISVFVFMRDNGRVPISNHSSTAVTTESKNFIENTDITLESGEEYSESFYSNFTEIYSTQESREEPTEKNTKVETDFSNAESTEIPTSGYAPVLPLETEPVEYPTSAETVAPTFPTTYPPTTAPTTIPVVTQPLTNPPTPTESSSQDDWAGVESSVVCYGYFSGSLLTGNGMVYFRLYDSNGKLVGDSDLYSSQHMSHHISQSGDKVCVQYFLEGTDLNLPKGKYTYYFYNENGVDVYQNSITL